MSGTSFTAQQYENFRDFLEKACGILLGDNKQYLVASRLGRIMTEHNIANLNDLVQQMQLFSRRELREEVIDAMTTNETLWFRDTHPFVILRERLLPELMASGTGPLRIWSAASSSGQEPFSISMVVEEYRAACMGVLKRPVEIVATDLSKSMLDMCRDAIYDQLSLGRGLTQERLQRFFERRTDNRWQVKQEVRQRVRFQQLNLLDSYSALGKFDLIYCRNVLIYFSAERKADILRRMHASLRPGGYLILGSSEALTDAADRYQMVQCSPGIIYKAT
jgi:chemotaxis protein methyltransferase CheR